MNFNEDLVSTWFANILKSPLPYREPSLTKETISCFKSICDALNLTGHVFMIAVNVFEDLVYVKGSALKDPLVTIVTTLFISAKIVGESHDDGDLNVSRFRKVLSDLYNQDVDPQLVKKAEIDIILTLHGKLPTTSKVDDLNIFLEVFCKPMNLKVNIRPPCEEILYLLQISWKRVFTELNTQYTGSQNAITMFKKLITNRLYVPAGIFLFIVQKSHLCNVFNVSDLTERISTVISINSTHIVLLCDVIKKLYSEIQEN